MASGGKPRSKTKKSKCGYCGEEKLWQNLKTHCQEIHGKPLLVEGETPLTSAWFKKKRKLTTLEIQEQSTSTLPVERKELTIDEKLDDILVRVKDIQISCTKKETLDTSEEINAKKNKQEIIDVKHDERLDYLKRCRSVQEICNSFQEFSYNVIDGCFLCVICSTGDNSDTSFNKPGIFNYSSENGLSFMSGEKIPMVFSSLKRNLKDHLSSRYHLLHTEHDDNESESTKRKRGKNYEIGMRIARLCYSIYREGRSQRSFEVEVVKRIRDGLDMGDLNHSYNFPAKFRPFVASEIHQRMSMQLQTRLIQTGFLPPLNIVADKGTSHHRTRQFLMVITVIPDADKLIQPVYLGQPIVKLHDGKGVALSIKHGLDNFGIIGSQIEGSSHDGQYFHLSVPTYLRELYKLEDSFFSTNDPLHLAGTTDVHLRKDPTFEWMVKLFFTCKELYNKFNWGKNYELLLETCNMLELNMATLVNFQTTRFANSVRFVVINIRDDYEAIVETLKKLYETKKNSRDSTDQEHSKDAQRILRQITNKKYCLRLSGLSDIYNLFGVFVNEVQKVNVLPHERYDNALKVLDRMREMKDHIDLKDCFTNQDKNCIWPCYHKDLKTLSENNNYQNTYIEHDRPSQLYQTRLSVRSDVVEVQRDVMQQVRDDLFILTFRLENDLRTDVFPKEVINSIEKIRFITDLQSVVREIAEKGSILVGSLRAKKYLAYIRSLTHTLNEISDSDIVENYKVFLKRVEQYAKEKMINSSSSSIEIIKDFLSSDKKLYDGVEITLQGLVCATVKISVESVVESLVSRYEVHFDKTRQLTEENALDEMEITENGPSLFRADRLLEKAMNNYWKVTTKKSDWHFVRSSQLNFSSQSKTVSRLLKEPSKFPIMDI